MLDNDPNYHIAKKDRWYANLNFVVYDKVTKDGAFSVKPDLAAGEGLQPGERLSRCPLNDNDKVLQIPVEFRTGWPDLIRQAGTYAQCLFDASPLRQFALALGFEYVMREFHFLIFHRGGLTASRPLAVDSDTRDIVRIFMSILAWLSASDAGLPEWSNNTEFCLPRKYQDDEGIVATVDEVLHNVLCVRGRAVRVSRVSFALNSAPIEPNSSPLAAETAQDKSLVAELHPITISQTQNHSPKFVRQPIPNLQSAVRKGEMNKQSHRFEAIIKSSWIVDSVSNVNVEGKMLQACNGLFGTPKRYYSFAACHRDHQSITNHLFLPQDLDERHTCYWNVFNLEPPIRPEFRSLHVHALAYMGCSLVTASTPWNRFVALGHAMLGWLSMCQTGYQHGDISIGNVVMMEKGIKMQRFKVRRYDEDGSKKVVPEDVVKLLAQLSIGGPKNAETQLEDVIEQLGISDMCTGFAIDWDMAIDWNTYFDSTHHSSRSGTTEFMSDTLLQSDDKYLRSPIDDIFSFFYVAQWAVVYNDQSGPNGPNVEDLRHRIADNFDTRSSATSEIITRIYARSVAAYNLFIVRCAPFLREWHASFVYLNEAWELSADWAASASGGKDISKYYIPQCRRFALYGVLSYLQLLDRFRSQLKKDF